jgi:hypothetical protein
MCPGLTSPGGALDDEVDAETPVVWNWTALYLECLFLISSFHKSWHLWLLFQF